MPFEIFNMRVTGSIFKLWYEDRARRLVLSDAVSR